MKVPRERGERELGEQGRVVVAVGLYPFKPALERDRKRAERQWIVRLAKHRSGIGEEYR